MRDIEGRIERAAVECAVVDHCNLACAGCDHSSPFLAKHVFSAADFERDAQALARALHVKHLRIVGGEPLLHPDLPALLAAARASGLADNVELWTNGVLLHRADSAIFRHIHALRLTVYPGVRLRVDFDEMQRLADRHGFQLRVEPRNEFLQSVLNEPIAEPATVSAIFSDCKNTHVWSCHAFQNGRYYKCSRAPYIAKRLLLLGQSVDIETADGVSLHDTSDLRADLERYLSLATPLQSCNWCLGTSGKKFPHHQLGREERVRELSARPELEGLVRLGTLKGPSPKPLG